MSFDDLGADGPLGPLGPAASWAQGGSEELDFGLTSNEVEGVLTGIADQLIQRLQARANLLVANPGGFIEDEVRRQMMAAAACGDYAELQNLTELLVAAAAVAPKLRQSATPS